MARPAFVEREREKIAGRSRIGEFVFGVQDGITSTVGIVSSMVGGHQSSAVTLFVGSAAAIAGMWSMAVGSYMSSSARADVSRVEIRRERRRIRSAPGHERRELEAIYESHGMPRAMARGAAGRVANDPERLLAVMASEELGVDERRAGAPIKDAVAMACSFFAGAVVPIAPYAVLPAHAAFTLSIVLACAALFAAGIVKARVVGLHVWRSAVQVLALGGAAALLGYLFGTSLPALFGVRPAGG
jgi:vacuolar iron transporter family protein